MRIGKARYSAHRALLALIKVHSREITYYIKHELRVHLQWTTREVCPIDLMK